ncbi:MAG: sigma-54-dependent Fis family transcriptional regulator [Deltaproteobacteria bacterium]|nr:sigma-54-dependent Fis family transcriptional regulator [Deltaproteobacteria bacterium]
MAEVEKSATILIVDHGVRQSFYMVLKDEFKVLLAESGNEAIDVFSKNAVDLILLDILLPDINGIKLLEKFMEMDPNTEVIMVTAVKEIQTAVNAIKLGAYEYIIKPFNVDEVLSVIHRALEKHSLVKEVTYLKHELKRFHPFEKMVGEDKKMRKIFELIATIAQSDGTVIIQGESGTGKELVARAIHRRSSKKDHPFVVINCAAIPPTLMESEIFGHNKGAFTGAVQTSTGKLEIAHKGTVFFDDIDSLDINMQGKLLRVIQEKEFERLGSNKIIEIDVRFIAASNKDLEELISKGEFRQDLFYRLNIFPVQLPPLRERMDDIPALLDHFLKMHSSNRNLQAKSFSQDAIKLLMKYDWPGNIRELENLVERLSTLCKEPVIHLKDIPMFTITKTKIKDMPLKAAVKTFEKQYIGAVLESVDWSRTKASEILGIHRNTLLAKINELDMKL